jgi:hypothetical protein
MYDVLVISALVLSAVALAAAVVRQVRPSQFMVLTMAVDWFEVGDTLTLSDGNEYEIISRARGAEYTEYRIAKVKRVRSKEAMLATS